MYGEEFHKERNLISEIDDKLKVDLYTFGT